MIRRQYTANKAKRKGMGITTVHKRISSYPANGCIRHLSKMSVCVSNREFSAAFSGDMIPPGAFQSVLCMLCVEHTLCGTDGSLLSPTGDPLGIARNNSGQMLVGFYWVSEMKNFMDSGRLFQRALFIILLWLISLTLPTALMHPLLLQQDSPVLFCHLQNY